MLAMGGVYRIGEFAKRIGRSVSTVRRWEADVRKILRPGFAEADRLTIVYCRVSSAGRKTDLTSQVTAMERFCLYEKVIRAEFAGGGG